MTLTKKLLLFCVLMLTSLSCSFTNILQYRQLPNSVFGSKNGDSSSPEVMAEEFLEDTLIWNCQANDLRDFLGENWEKFPTDLQDLIIDVKSTGDTLNYEFSFSHTDPLIIKTDPDHWAPPGATQVPDGEYDVVTRFQAYGSAKMDYVYKGKVTVDYEVTTYLPTPSVNTGSLEYTTVGYVSQSGSPLEICFDVIADQDHYNYLDHPTLLRENCRWPGYSFTCTPAP